MAKDTSRRKGSASGSRRRARRTSSNAQRNDVEESFQAALQRAGFSLAHLVALIPDTEELAERLANLYRTALRQRERQSPVSVPAAATIAPAAAPAAAPSSTVAALDANVARPRTTTATASGSSIGSSSSSVRDRAYSRIATPGLALPTPTISSLYALRSSMPINSGSAFLRAHPSTAREKKLAYVGRVRRIVTWAFFLDFSNQYTVPLHARRGSHLRNPGEFEQLREGELVLVRHVRRSTHMGHNILVFDVDSTLERLDMTSITFADVSIFNQRLDEEIFPRIVPNYRRPAAPAIRDGDDPHHRPRCPQL
ncbi:hypothetical protein sr12904 [Sporisorium reilianum SRZ2]|uniref:Uncharacterized protein n=1 Tax=Sporisorium reilianum (strain SRZ2) TaxID=999809 RepID=E6ZXU0_SPORE|nr:hypothetical protein sr12904 [Sporisorium reilianum SRZ2]